VVIVFVALAEVFEVLWMLAELVELELDCEELEEIVGVGDGDDEIKDSEFVVPELPPTTELLV
jgi:hypothetical protein